jgi:epsilon-lactone hydrolase
LSFSACSVRQWAFIFRQLSEFLVCLTKQGAKKFMSYLSWTIFKILKMIRFKERIDFMHPKRSAKVKAPYFSNKKYSTTELMVLGRPVLPIRPIESKALAHVVYFHGGGYSIEASGLHFQLMKQLIDLANCTVTYMDYPLAPEFSVVDTMDMALEAYSQLLLAHPEHQFVLMGDSAGGGLALSLSMLIRDKGLKDAKKIILFSPWLDIKLTNERISLYEKRDFVLNAESLRKIGEIYRGDLHASHYLVSPKYGDLKGLGDIAVFFGSEEIFYPDCLEFCGANSTGSARVTAYEYAGMQHDWVILPIPEAHRALDEAVVFMREAHAQKTL